MALTVLLPGLQTSLQAGPRNGFRHKGVPASGPADMLSHAIANRLVGNTHAAPALEITLTGAKFRFETNCAFALSGGESTLSLGPHRIERHSLHYAKAGDTVTIETITKGARLYLAVSGGFECDAWLGSHSTYLPAALGGYKGRALQVGDKLNISLNKQLKPKIAQATLPQGLRPHFGHSWMLRAAPGVDHDLLMADSQRALFSTPFTVSHRASRMGAELIGAEDACLSLRSDGRLPSAAVFPGTLQCPPSGHPFLLMADAQTTGGYPNIAQIIRADRHMLGQLRPGDRVQLKQTTPEDAARILIGKTKLLQTWLGDAFELG